MGYDMNTKNKSFIRMREYLQDHNIENNLFMLETKNEELMGIDLYEELKHIDGMTKMIGTGQEIVPLTDEEVEFIQHFGGEDKIVQMSEGIIENSQVKILSGPLEGMEAFIRKIDRHKRKAWLEIEMFGRMQRVEVGLEIISKTV